MSQTENRLAAGPIDETDRALLASVRAVVEAADPVPDGMIARITFALTFDALQLEVAQLQWQSSASPAYRGADETPEEVQTITFSTKHLNTTVTITARDANHVRLDGWVSPNSEIEVELRQPGGSQTTVADADGRFAFRAVPRGIAQFVLRLPDGDSPSIITPAMEF